MHKVMNAERARALFGDVSRGLRKFAEVALGWLAQPPPNRHRLYFAFGTVVAVGPLVLMDQYVAVVGAIGLEPMTSCV